MILFGLTYDMECEILGKGGKSTGTYANRNLLQISNLMVTPHFMVDHPFLMTLNTIAIVFVSRKFGTHPFIVFGRLYSNCGSLWSNGIPYQQQPCWVCHLPTSFG